MNKYKVIDLFSGIGGLSYGFYHNPSFEIVMANEYDKEIAKAYTLNHKDVFMINDDIKNLTTDLLKKYQKDRIDLIIGGPPCQSYSTLGKRKMDDRAILFEEYFRILNIIRPKMFIFENVSGLLSMQKGKLIETIKDKFSSLGYTLKMKLLDAANYGVPQHRERVILVGCLNKNNFKYPEITHGEGKGLLPFLTLEDALSDLPHLKSGEIGTSYILEPQNDLQRFYRANCKTLTEDEAPKNGQQLIRIMEALKDGESKDDLPIELRPKSGYSNTYAKMWWKKSAPTITRNFATPSSSSRCIHPIDSRALTTREGARLQSFPDDYLFYGSKSKKNLEIGNAVPPLLSITLCKEVINTLKKY